jgi:hypothetical protein
MAPMARWPQARADSHDSSHHWTSTMAAAAFSRNKSLTSTTHAQALSPEQLPRISDELRETLKNSSSETGVLAMTVVRLQSSSDTRRASRGLRVG